MIQQIFVLELAAQGASWQSLAFALEMIIIEDLGF